MFDLLQLLRGKGRLLQNQACQRPPGRRIPFSCPLCGGTDRFTVFPAQAGGELCQKHGIDGTWACPRGCGRGGDVISWFMEVEGLSFAEACAELKIPLEGREQQRRSYRPLRAPRQERAEAFAPCLLRSADGTMAHPGDKAGHRSPCAAAGNTRHAALPRGPRSAGGGSAAYRLGYIEAEGKQTDCIFRARAAFGLPEKKSAQGKRYGPSASHAASPFRFGMTKANVCASESGDATQIGTEVTPRIPSTCLTSAGPAVFRSAYAVTGECTSRAGHMGSVGGGTGRDGHPPRLRRHSRRTFDPDRAGQTGSEGTRGTVPGGAHSGGPRCG